MQYAYYIVYRRYIFCHLNFCNLKLIHVNIFLLNTKNYKFENCVYIFIFFFINKIQNIDSVNIFINEKECFPL